MNKSRLADLHQSLCSLAVQEQDLREKLLTAEATLKEGRDLLDSHRAESINLKKQDIISLPDMAAVTAKMTSVAEVLKENEKLVESFKGEIIRNHFEKVKISKEYEELASGK